MKIKKEELFQCSECGLHYRDKNLAQKCQKFCEQNQACSMEIARQSIEYVKEARQ